MMATYMQPTNVMTSQNFKKVRPGILFDCHIGCFWPAHVPDQLNHAPDWTGKCAAAQKDWRKLDLIFP